MIKCSNCGSTAQVKVKYISNPSRTAIIERIICGCGCITTMTYKLVREETCKDNYEKDKYIQKIK